MSVKQYDTSQSYEWNYGRAPKVVAVSEPQLPGQWCFCGLPVGSPLGVAAGPLLNGSWCLYYASLGFDVVTYKTVRSRERACYPAPNLTPVVCSTLAGGETDLPASDEFAGSWAISFGMPSQPPSVWTADVRATRQALPAHKKISVSVVGTFQPGWSLEQLADDYAECAHLAAEHGADAVEINLSCPNVTSCDGQLFQNPAQAAEVVGRTRRAIGELPLIAKIGHDPSDQLCALLDAVAADLDAVSTVNCLAATVQGQFEGQPRGIGGRAILDASVRQVERIAEWKSRHAARLAIIGVGGVFTSSDVRRYLSAGAECTHLATAIMRDPQVGLQIRRELAVSIAR